MTEDGERKTGLRSPVSLNESMQKTILIFGAGLNQYQLIKAARDLGIRSVVQDPDADTRGKDD